MVVTSRFLCLPAQFENISTVKEIVKKFPKILIEVCLFPPSWTRGKKNKRKKNHSALPASLDDLVEGAQVKTTKYTTNTQ